MSVEVFLQVCSLCFSFTCIPNKAFNQIQVSIIGLIHIVIRIGARPGCALVITPVYLLLTGISTPADTGANSHVTAGLTPLIPSLTQLQIMKLPYMCLCYLTSTPIVL